jgi:thiol:disulfide interchange protein
MCSHPPAAGCAETVAAVVLAIISGFWVFLASDAMARSRPRDPRLRLVGDDLRHSLLLIGAASGGTRSSRPLGKRAQMREGERRSLRIERAPAFQRIKTVAGFDAAVASATAAGKPVMLDFMRTGSACRARKWGKAHVQRCRRAGSARGAVLLQADVTANDEADSALLARFEIFGPPTICVLRPRRSRAEKFQAGRIRAGASFRRACEIRLHELI